jgi:hypothetical protein
MHQANCYTSTHMVGAVTLIPIQVSCILMKLSMNVCQHNLCLPCRYDVYMKPHHKILHFYVVSNTISFSYSLYGKLGNTKMKLSID